MSLLLAIAIWFLIKEYLREQSELYYYDPKNPPPKALPVPESEQ